MTPEELMALLQVIARQALAIARMEQRIAGLEAMVRDEES